VDRAAAELHEILDQPAQAGRVGADTLSEMRENSSLVRPIAKFSTSNAPPRSITLSKIALRMFESIRWPSARPPPNGCERPA
jgi:hypothetical protein